MRKIELTLQASDDFDAIFLDGLERFGYRQADRFRDAIIETFSLLAGQPFLGEDISEILAGVRVFRRPPPCRIVYRFTDDLLTILRIFHGQQDYEKLLG